MILMIDNYDSFTYNLYQYILKLGYECMVKRNDQIQVHDIENLNPDKIIISPGPGRPEDAGISMEAIKYFGGKIPILGVCLGHQTIAAAYGIPIIKAAALYHGKTSKISHNGEDIFKNCPQNFKATRYHSLAADRTKFPEEIIVTARTDDGEVMGLKHKTFPLFGVQFHPESIASESGMTILKNFLEMESPAGTLVNSTEIPGHRNGLPDKDLVSINDGTSAKMSKTASTKGGMPDQIMKKAIKKTVSGENLAFEEAQDVMAVITEGNATEGQIGSLLTALTVKEPSAEEIAGFAKIMRLKADKVPAPEGIKLLDTCGTGGDKSSTFNISTACAFVNAAAGVYVAKHGNRSVTSSCGSADVLESMGIELELTPPQLSKTLETTGMMFMFAPLLHKSMKHAVPVRKALGIRTVFNILGPLSNPAGADFQVIGVFEKSLVKKVAEVLALLGTEHALVVHGEDGLDEMTICGKTFTAEVNGKWISHYDFFPEDAGLKTASPETLKGGNAGTNRNIIYSIFSGEKGAARDIVLLNSAAGLKAAGKVSSIREGVKTAAEIIDSGAAMKKIQTLREATRSLKT